MQTMNQVQPTFLHELSDNLLLLSQQFLHHNTLIPTTYGRHATLRVTLDNSSMCSSHSPANIDLLLSKTLPKYNQFLKLYHH